MDDFRKEGGGTISTFRASWFLGWRFAFDGSPSGRSSVGCIRCTHDVAVPSQQSRHAQAPRASHNIHYATAERQKVTLFSADHHLRRRTVLADRHAVGPLPQGSRRSLPLQRAAASRIAAQYQRTRRKRVDVIATRTQREREGVDLPDPGPCGSHLAVASWAPAAMALRMCAVPTPRARTHSPAPCRHGFGLPVSTAAENNNLLLRPLFNYKLRKLPDAV